MTTFEGTRLYECKMRRQFRDWLITKWNIICKKAQNLKTKMLGPFNRMLFFNVKKRKRSILIIHFWTRDNSNRVVMLRKSPTQIPLQ